MILNFQTAMAAGSSVTAGVVVETACLFLFCGKLTAASLPHLPYFYYQIVLQVLMSSTAHS